MVKPKAVSKGELRKTDKDNKVLINTAKEEQVTVKSNNQIPSRIDGVVGDFKTTPSTPRTRHEQTTDIAVIGMAGMFADSQNIEEYWENLREKKDLVKTVPPDHFDYLPWYSEKKEGNKLYCKWGGFIDHVDRFDAGFFSISPREAEVMDPQLRLLLQVLFHTFEDAGYAGRIRGTNTGIYVGACSYDYQKEMDSAGKPVGPYDGSGNAPTMLPNRPSFFFDLKGPSVLIDTACSSSLVALHMASKALQRNECEMAIVAGVNLILGSWHYRYFCSIDALTHSGRCHTFDERADGYLPGEGVGAVLLKPLSQAVQDNDRIHAIIKGSATCHGGYTLCNGTQYQDANKSHS